MIPYAETKQIHSSLNKGGRGRRYGNDNLQVLQSREIAYRWRNRTIETIRTQISTTKKGEIHVQMSEISQIPGAWR